MTCTIDPFDHPVAVVGGGALCAADFEAADAFCSSFIAADGGAGAILAAGRVPDAVIGDFDSLSSADRARIPPDRLFRIDEQNSTDFDKVLRTIRAPLVLGIGFCGRRVDHQLAAFSILLRQPAGACVLLCENELIFHAPRLLDLPLRAGDIVSLYPMGRVTGRSAGLEWPIDGLVFEPVGQIGTSNRARGPVSLRLDGDGMLAMVPRRALADVVAALTA